LGLFSHKVDAQANESIGVELILEKYAKIAKKCVTDLQPGLLITDDNLVYAVFSWREGDL
jgi:hypothetical protein